MAITNVWNDGTHWHTGARLARSRTECLRVWKLGRTPDGGIITTRSDYVEHTGFVVAQVTHVYPVWLTIVWHESRTDEFGDTWQHAEVEIFHQPGEAYDAAELWLRPNVHEQRHEQNCRWV